jgi:hypothetical protein
MLKGEWHMKILKIISSLILSILMIISLAFFQPLLFVKTNALDASYYIKKFDDNKFYSDVHEYINSELSTYIKEYNLPASLLEDIVTQEWVTIEMRGLTFGFLKYINNEGTPLPIIDVFPLIDSFCAKLQSHLNESGPAARIISKSVVANTRKKIIISLTDKPFLSTWDHSNEREILNTINEIRGLSNRISKYFIYSLCTLILCAAVLAIIWKRPKPIGYWMGTNFALGGIILFISKIILDTSLSKRLSGFILDRARDLPVIKYIAPITQDIIKDFSNSLLMGAGITVFIGAICIGAAVVISLKQSKNISSIIQTETK